MTGTLGDCLAALTANEDIVAANGYRAIPTSANVGLIATTGRHLLDNHHTERIRQSGNLTAIRLYLGTISAVTEFWIYVWRKNGTTWDIVGRENILAKLTGSATNTVTLTTPISVQAGDYLGFGGTTTNDTHNVLAAALSVGTASMYYGSMAEPESSVIWTNQTAATFLIPCIAYMRAPHVVFIGDSIAAGHPANYSFIEPEQTTDPTSDPAALLATAASCTVQNMGIGSQTSTQIAARFAADVVALRPRVCIIEAGLNDIIGGSITQATFVANMTAMLDACQNNRIVPVVLGLPWTNGTNTQMQTYDTWLAALQTVMADYPTALYIDTRATLGQFRAGGDAGNLWDIKTEYDSDGIHYNAAGYDALADTILAATYADPGVWTAWGWVAPVTVTNPPTADGYQVEVAVTYAAEMQPDFEDLRFATDDGLPLPHIVESYTASTSAVIRVRVPAGTESFKLYYGNDAATSISDGSRVYELFEPASGSSLDATVWASTANATVSDGTAAFTGGTGETFSMATYGPGYAVRARLKVSTVSTTSNPSLSGVGFWSSSPLGRCVAYTSGDPYGQKYSNYAPSAWNHVAMPAGMAANTFYILDGARLSDRVVWSRDGGTATENATQYPTGQMYLYLAYNAATVTVDWIAVRKCQATEPVCTVGTAGPNLVSIVAEIGRSLGLEAGTVLEGAITAETGRTLTPEGASLARGPDMVAELGRSLAPEAAAALETTVAAEMGRTLTLAATAPLEVAITAEMARNLEPYADAYEAATELIAEIGRTLTLAATAPLEVAITAELARTLGPEAGTVLATTVTAELARALTPAATAPITLTLTAAMERGLSLTPPRTTYWYNFDGVKWISSTVRRSITDHFWQLDEEISGAEELPIDFLRQAKVITQDLHGTSRCIFYGMLPGINQKIAWRNDTTTIRGHDHGWRLSDQKVPAARRVISPTVDPRDVILEFLGGDRWETKTEVRPYRIAPLTAYGTEAMPAHQWEFSPETSCMEAIREFDEKCDRIFLVKWMQIGNAISVDNPDPSRRLMRVEAEDFDPGGEGVGYHDIDTRNLGGAFRTGEGVDIENTPGEGGRNVGWIRDGEWLDFTREFAWAGSYAFSARVGAAAQATPAYFKVYLDGIYQFRVNVGAAPTSDAGYRTGSYQVFTNTDPDRLTSTSGVALADAPQYLDITSTGDHVIRLEFWGNTEDVTPSNMHQNIARFDLSPQGGSEIDPEDVRYQSIAYWVDEAKIDSATEGLDLPPPLTISDPGRWPKDETIQITKQARQRYNRVIVRGHSASGVWFEATAQTGAVAAGEPPSEYLETNDRVTTGTIQGYANALLAYYQLDQRSYQCTLMQRMELEIYQKICFTDHPQLPSSWCRITSVEKRVDGKADICTITFVPEQTLAAQRRLQRMLRPTNSSAITDVVRSEIAKQSEVWVGTCAEILDDDTANFTLEQGGTSRGRITPDG